MKGKNFKPKNCDQLDTAYWQKIVADPAEAKKALIGLMTPDGPVEFVQLADGTQIKTTETTEEQAHEFMCALCPTWAKN